MRGSPGAEVERLLRRLTGDIQQQLPETLVGVYLFGSLVAGDFDRERSDLDLLAVVSADVEERDVERLREMHERLVEDHPAWRDRVEVGYVSTAALEAFRTRPRLMARISPGEPLHRTEADRHHLLDWYLARQAGVALFGPPPERVIPEITRAEFVGVVREHASAWQDWVADMRHPGGQAYAVLTMCRALHTSAHGEQVSKKRAAQAARLLLPEWADLIGWALRWRYGGGPQTPDQDRFPEVVRFVDDARQRVLSAARTGPGR